MHVSVPGNGAASVIDMERVRCYWPSETSTREDTGYTQRLYNLANVLGVAQPAAIQMSAYEATRANAQEEATPLVECALTPRGYGKRRALYAKTIASTIQWASHFL